jgi:hypothetical protein
MLEFYGCSCPKGRFHRVSRCCSLATRSTMQTIRPDF